MKSYEVRKTQLVRNIGWAVLCAIPYILGGGALVWALAVLGWWDISKELRQERRAAESVGIHVYPRSTIKLTIADAPCIKADQAYLDGDHISFYAVNRCKGGFIHSWYGYRVLAPDGTVLQSHQWRFSGEDYMAAGERKEITQNIEDDARIDSVYVYLKDGDHE
jgi:hypothetical protein